MNDQYRNPDKPTIGTLSGWEKITTNRADGTPVATDHGFTLVDLLALVRAMRAEFDPDRIAEISELIERHIARTDNPHLTDLSKMGTSVIQELYLLWKENGHPDGTREEFLKVIFQYVKIADVAATIEGTAHDQVVTALGLSTVMKIHDEDPYAHDALFSRLFPGEPVKAYPTYSLQGILGMPVNAVVSRSSTMTVFTNTGQIKTVAANTIDVDWSTGRPCFPIFGSLTNLLEESENINNTGQWRASFATVERDASVPFPRNVSQGCWAIKETTTATPEVHGITYVRETANIVAGKYYTITAFVAPSGRNCVGIEVFDYVNDDGRFGFLNSNLLPFDQGTFMGTSFSAEAYRNIHYNLETGDIFISQKSENMYGYIYPLYNGWYRIQFTFKALTSMPASFRIYALDIYDGDVSYEGKSGLGIAVFGLTLTEGCFLPPYIPSLNGSKGSITATSIKIPVGSWYRKDAGTIATAFNNNTINTSLAAVSEIYNLGNGSSALSHVARIPINNRNRCFLGGYGTNNGTLASTYTKECTQQWLVLMHAYRYDSHLFGGRENDIVEVDTSAQINQNVSYLYLGCDRYERNQLNGFVRSWVYYPEYLVAGNMKFFNSLE